MIITNKVVYLRFKVPRTRIDSMNSFSRLQVCFCLAEQIQATNCFDFLVLLDELKTLLNNKTLFNTDETKVCF